MRFGNIIRFRSVRSDKQCIIFKNIFPLHILWPSKKFQTDGIDLFVEKFGQLINVTQSGQMAVRDLLKAYLHRVERDAKGTAVGLYPFTRKRDMSEPKVVVIDPHISYG